MAFVKLLIVACMLGLHVAGAETPGPQPTVDGLSKPNLAAKARSLYSWMSKPSNLDKRVWKVLRKGLPADFLATLADPNTVATLFLPGGKTLLNSPAVQKALAAPKDVAPKMLATVLKAHMILGDRISKSGLKSIHFGRVLESAAGTDLLFTHGDVRNGTVTYSITFVNMVKVVSFDHSAGQAVVHILNSYLPVDLDALST